MAEHDLTARMAAQMDRHLVFPLLEFLQKRQLYPRDEILEAKLRLLSGTNMVDDAMDIHRLFQVDVPADMVARRSKVIARLSALKTAAAPFVAFLLNPQQLVKEKQRNRDMLQENFQIGPDQIEALYQYAKFRFECGDYPEAAASLNLYLALCTDNERSLSALWGKLAAEILLKNWDIAWEELDRLKEAIDSKSFSSSSPATANQLRTSSRVWLMHWSLFIFFNHENGKNGIVDLFLQDRYLNAIQMNAPHLLRYLAAALVVNKRRRSMLKEFIRVIDQQGKQCYRDPLTEFLECLYVKYDFHGAQQKLLECEQVILNDPFLGKRPEQGSSITVPLRDEFIENARLLIFEAYCRVHRRVDVGMLAEKMNMNYDEAELWMTHLVRTSKLDAKIDSVSGTLTMTTNHVNVHEQIAESTISLNMRSYMLAKSILDLEPAQASQQLATENLQF